MPIYYFDLRNDVNVDDEEGRELPDLAAAHAAALVEAREMITESVERGRVDLRHRIEVRDESGSIVHTLHFGDAIEVVPLEQGSATPLNLVQQG